MTLAPTHGAERVQKRKKDSLIGKKISKKDLRSKKILSVQNVIFNVSL